jgi:DNA-binding NtrC family response regulator
LLIDITEELTGDMLEMNGLGLAEEFFANHPDLRCHFLSGYTAIVIASQGVLEVILNFVQKFFSVRDLTTEVQNILAEKSLASLEARSLTIIYCLFALYSFVAV